MRKDEKLTYIDLTLNKKLVMEPRLNDNRYWLSAVDGLDGLDNDIYTVKGSGQDGETETGSSLQARVVTAFGSLRLDPSGSKRSMLRMFNPKNPARLVYENSAGSWYLNGRIKVAPRFIEGVFPTFQFDFYAPYPFWRAGDGNASHVADIALWVPNLEWTPYIEIPEEPEMIIEYREPSLIVNIPNEGDAEVGIIAEFRALAETANPSLINVVTQEVFSMTIDLEAGDVLKVWTGYGEKKAILYRGSTQINVFNCVDDGVTWLQLHTGDNLIRYNSESIDNIEVSIYYDVAYLGVG